MSVARKTTITITTTTTIATTIKTQHSLYYTRKPLRTRYQAHSNLQQANEPDCSLLPVAVQLSLVMLLLLPLTLPLPTSSCEMRHCAGRQAKTKPSQTKLGGKQSDSQAKSSPASQTAKQPTQVLHDMRRYDKDIRMDTTYGSSRRQELANQHGFWPRLWLGFLIQQQSAQRARSETTTE
ncbi:unnamed protein product [Ceratitis capitata]|uniref:(Mediterranean fruit fly) hypothetical protein n=1 Tax=Ceratitis capitata TaxID=7213 RepID=A0A811VB04_CERCA|nr:unnamed protein product [Ceratitis capitata]